MTTMQLGGIDVVSIDVAHDGSGALVLAGRPPLEFELEWNEGAEPEQWDVVADDLESEIAADLHKWARREVGQQFMNGEHGACPTRWAAAEVES